MAFEGTVIPTTLDVLSCKTASRCATCHHFGPAGCALEASVADYEQSLVARASRPAIAVTLAWSGAREDAATA